MKKVRIICLLSLFFSAVGMVRAADVTVGTNETRTQTTILTVDNLYMNNNSTLVMNAANIYIAATNAYFNGAAIQVNYSTGNPTWPSPTLNQSSANAKSYYIQAGGLTINTAAGVLTEMSGKFLNGTAGAVDGGLTVSGSGTVFVQNAYNTFTGDTVLTGGNLVYRASAVVKSALQLKNGMAQNNSANAINLATVTDAATTNSVTLAGNFSAANVAVNLAGSVTLGRGKDFSWNNASIAAATNGTLTIGTGATFRSQTLTIGTGTTLKLDGGKVGVGNNEFTTVASSLKVSNGTLTLSGGAISCATYVTFSGTSQFNSGTITASGDLLTYGGTTNFAGANATFAGKIENNGGTINFAAGTVDVTSYVKNTATTNIDGATLNVGKTSGNTAAAYVSLTGTRAVTNFKSGTINVNYYDTVIMPVRFNSFIVEDGATLNMSGGDLNLYGVLRLGNGTGTGTMTLSGGTVNVGQAEITNRSFFIGGNSGGVFNMTGGTLNVLNGNVIVGHGGQGTANISGGEIKSAGLYFFNNGTSSKINIDGGTFNIDALGCGSSDTYPGKGTMTLTGSKMVWNGFTGASIQKFEINTSSSVTFNLDANGFAAINAETVNLAGTLVAGSFTGLNAYSDPILLARGMTTYTNTGTMQSASDAIYNLQSDANTNSLYAILNSDILITDAVVSKNGIVFTSALGRGAVAVTFPIDEISLVTNIAVDEELDNFVLWLNDEGLPDGITALVNNYDTNSVDLVGLVVKDDGKMVWDFTNYNDGAAMLSAVNFHDASEIPEPASVVLLAFGMGLIFVSRRKSVLFSKQ